MSDYFPSSSQASPVPSAGPAAVPSINQEQVVDPWDVKGAVVDGIQQDIDYNKLIEQFGTKHITPELLERFERLTQRKLHPLLRRGMFFSHRCVIMQSSQVGYLIWFLTIMT